MSTPATPDDHLCTLFVPKPYSCLCLNDEPHRFASQPAFHGRLIQVLPWMKLCFVLPLHCFTDTADLRLFRTLIRNRHREK